MTKTRSIQTTKEDMQILPAEKRAHCKELSGEEGWRCNFRGHTCGQGQGPEEDQTNAVIQAFPKE